MQKEVAFAAKKVIVVVEEPVEEAVIRSDPNRTLIPGLIVDAVSITFDNLGEAAELERGTWPKDIPLGQHYSVTRILPTILKMLDELGLSATFFVEGLNAELYPQALQGIVAAGHEVGYHAWRHEEWHKLSYADEVRILERGLPAMSKLAIRPYGFRPPRGALTASSVKLLKNLGFTYCSPAGSSSGISEGLVILPFEWPHVDAYAYLAHFGSMREKFGNSHTPLSPAHFHANLRSALGKVVQNQGYLSLLFHPFVEEKEEYFEVMYSTLEELRTLIYDGTVWSAPCREVAYWILSHPIDFETTPSFDVQHPV
ncbi:MAG TPA: polysaccharide deacetylase family protein [Ktedonobacteraceae bacterium]|nr:polysaccharide deacetylase family protein [Ktedonobacteraceae bacterium]